MSSPDPDHRFLVCPRCYSTDISFEAAAFMGQKYHCGDCDLVTTFIIEATADEVAELRSEERGETEEDTEGREGTEGTEGG